MYLGANPLKILGLLKFPSKLWNMYLVIKMIFVFEKYWGPAPTKFASVGPSRFYCKSIRNVKKKKKMKILLKNYYGNFTSLVVVCSVFLLYSDYPFNIIIIVSGPCLATRVQQTYWKLSVMEVCYTMHAAVIKFCLGNFGFKDHLSPNFPTESCSYFTVSKIC